MWCSTPWPSDAAAGARPQRLTRRSILLTVGALLTPLPWALASNTGSAHPALPGSHLLGEATLRFFGLRVYQARLWALPDFDADRLGDQPLVLELTYLRQLRGEAIAERSVVEMRRAGGFSDAQAERWLADMKRIFPDVKDGDRLTGRLEPGTGARFEFNGQVVGQINDTLFGRLFFGIWLAPTTSEPQMRLALLGRDQAR